MVLRTETSLSKALEEVLHAGAEALDLELVALVAVEPVLSQPLVLVHRELDVRREGKFLQALIDFLLTRQRLEEGEWRGGRKRK